MLAFLTPRCSKSATIRLTSQNAVQGPLVMDGLNTSLLSRVGSGITKFRNFVFNTLFIVIIVLLSVGLLSTCQQAEVQSNSALILNPAGVIVESPSWPDPLQGLLSGSSPVAQVGLDIILATIEHAANDDDIEMIVLDLDDLVRATPAQAQRIGLTLASFKETGKKVVAYGYFYGQDQYHIASFADAIYMHPMGQVILQGFGGFNFYVKDLLEKFDVKVHVFRVGEYKSAVEPLTRSDMSQEARLADESLYQNLWQQLLTTVAANRQLTKQQVQDYANLLAGKLAETNGDLARAALENHLVDELLTTDQATVRLADDVGFSNDQGEINGIEYQSYAQIHGLHEQNVSAGSPVIALIVAQGVLVTNEIGRSVVNAQEIIQLIRQVRHDANIKALVLRVDSPGGSQFASELIRQEIELVQLAGKPVVASFGSSAASGGYWIASTADSIIAEPATITGSIGIFSYITTFEDTLAKYGVHTDGVTTTPFTGLSQFTGINEPMAQVQQARVENGYEQFINLVARGRNMSVEEIESIAEGRVWSGDVAFELGLVDHLGGLNEAFVRAGGELADLNTWQVKRLSTPIDPRAAIFAELMSSQAHNSVHKFTQLAELIGLKSVTQLRTTLAVLDDPFDTYALCMQCDQSLMPLFNLP